MVRRTCRLVAKKFFVLALREQVCTMIDVMNNIILNISLSTTLALALIEAVENYTTEEAHFGCWGSDDASALRAAERALEAAEAAVAAHTGIVDKVGGRDLWRWAYAQAGVEPSHSVLM